MTRLPPAQSPALNHDLSCPKNGGKIAVRAPSENELAMARAAEIQALQERQVSLVVQQENIASGMTVLQAGAQAANSMLPLLSQLMPADTRQIGGIVSGRADVFDTTTTFEIYVETDETHRDHQTDPYKGLRSAANERSQRTSPGNRCGGRTSSRRRDHCDTHPHEMRIS
jgi:hypothetical protein